MLDHRQWRTKRLKFSLAQANIIITDADKYPRAIVSHAEDVYRNAAAKNAKMVGQIAITKNWFNAEC
jgi:hypothetical protein